MDPRFRGDDGPRPWIPAFAGMTQSPMDPGLRRYDAIAHGSPLSPGMTVVAPEQAGAQMTRTLLRSMLCNNTRYTAYLYIATCNPMYDNMLLR